MSLLGIDGSNSALLWWLVYGPLLMVCRSIDLMKRFLLLACSLCALTSPVLSDPINDCVRRTADAPMSAAGRRMICLCIAGGGDNRTCAQKAMNAGY